MTRGNTVCLWVWLPQAAGGGGLPASAGSGVGGPPLCTSLRTGPNSAMKGAAPSGCLSQCGLQKGAPPPPHLVPSHISGRGCVCSRHGGGGWREAAPHPMPYVLEGQMEKYKKPLVWEADPMAGWPVTLAGGLSLSEEGEALDRPKAGGALGLLRTAPLSAESFLQRGLPAPWGRPGGAIFTPISQMRKLRLGSMAS